MGQLLTSIVPNEEPACAPATEEFGFVMGAMGAGGWFCATCGSAVGTVDAVCSPAGDGTACVCALAG
jgi:hypothetical protein